jgi:hypothetical protein
MSVLEHLAKFAKILTTLFTFLLCLVHRHKPIAHRIVLHTGTTAIDVTALHATRPFALHRVMSVRIQRFVVTVSISAYHAVRGQTRSVNQAPGRIGLSRGQKCSMQTIFVFRKCRKPSPLHCSLVNRDRSSSAKMHNLSRVSSVTEYRETSLAMFSSDMRGRLWFYYSRVGTSIAVTFPPRDTTAKSDLTPFLTHPLS